MIKTFNGFKDPGSIPEGFVFRTQKGRYPWWVKSVNHITTPVDTSTWERKTTDKLSILYVTERQKTAATLEKARERMIEKIKNSEPGSRLQDFALHYASETYFASGTSRFGTDFKGQGQKIHEIVGTLIHPPEDLGLTRWEGTEKEASALLETAGIHLGASQVGFTALNPYWLEKRVRVDPDVKEIRTTEDGRTLVPESMKYVVVIAAQVPMAAQKRAPSQIGDAADRSGGENRQMAMERIINYIKGLGYKASRMPGKITPVIPFALMAGIGEMGRMNRLISPLYGGAVRLEAILTDLPLALDKPIDFGLQEFCRGCKKCAKACPAGALSMDKDPSWEPKGPYSCRGKKVFYDDCDKCAGYMINTTFYCGACLGSCTWNKDNKTLLHSMAKATGAKLPVLSPFMALMDDVFGYGLAPKRRVNEWWDLRLPIKGLDSHRTRS
jgi:reductive dehalogenase